MIVRHMRTDPNATKHMVLGFVGFVAVSVSFAPIVPTVWAALLCGLVAGYLTGIAIEVVQRIERRYVGVKQNTFRESVLDALVTGSWFLFFLVM